MKKSLKILAIVASLVLVLALLTGCGNNTANEVENNTISIRARDGKKQDNISIEDVITNLKEEIKTALDK